MKYDELVQYLGELGPYQKRIYVLANLPVIGGAIQTLMAVFVLAVPKHRCAIPGYPNDTYAVQDSYHRALIDYTVPANDNDSISRYSECNLYRGRSVLTFTNISHTSWTNETTACDHWVYDKSIFDNSFVTDTDLVCDDTILRSHANVAYMFGQLFGSLIFGYYSDRFGRRTALLTGILMATISSVCITFTDSYIPFVILRFIIATSCMGMIISSFVLSIELLGPKYRCQAGTAFQFFWCFGMFVLNGLAYAIRDWRHLQLAGSCWLVFLLLLYRLVPESPRWEISQGRLENARVTMEKVAKANKKELPVDAFCEAESDHSCKEKSQSVEHGKLMDVFASRVLLLRALIVFVNWLVVTMMYYGLTLNVGSLGGSIYLNFAVNGAVETLANVIAFFALPRLGRKPVHCFSLFLAGLSCLSLMIPAVMDSKVDDWVTIMLSNIGKFGATGGFTTIYIYTAELFPTFMRNSIVGTSSLVARLGSISAPYIADLGLLVGGKFGTALPYIVFGSSSLLAGTLALALPETLNMPTPETIQEAIHFGKKQKRESLTPMTHQSNGHKGEVNLAVENYP